MKSINKDIFREIKNSKGRFISILAIVALGVAFFAGVKTASTVMKHSADTYYDNNNMYDIKVTSQNGLTNSDINKIKNISSVDKIHGTYSLEALTTKENKESEVIIHGININSVKDKSKKDNVNAPTLIKGRYPKNNNECLIGVSSFGKSNYKLGSNINFYLNENNKINYFLKNTKYKVVGIVKIPLYLSYSIGTCNIGDGNLDSYVLISDEEFNYNVYTEAYVTCNKTKELDSYENKYFKEVNKTKDKIKDSLGSNYYILDRKSNYSYEDYRGAADKIDAIAKVFPIFFLLVAALVCLTTMTRMIDEERGNIGLLKALGYSKLKISSKYLLYSLLASTLGSLIGLIIGLILFPTVIYNAWGIMYTIIPVQLTIKPSVAIFTVLLFILITTLSSIAACYKDLTETPCLLMRPKAPKEGKKIFLERIKFIWNNLSFSRKVTARNLFRYKKRLSMTIVGIAGCGALLLAGFGIKNSISQVAEVQYKEIFKYDLRANIIDYKVNNIYKKDSRVKDSTMVNYLNGEVKYKDIKKDVSCIIPSNNKEFKEFYSLRKRGSNIEKTLKNNEVIITEKLGKDLKVKVGDYIKVNINKRESKKVKITAIVENYIGHIVYMNKKTYNNLFGSESVNNTLLIKKVKNNNKSLVKDLVKEKNINYVVDYSTFQENFNKIISSLNYVIIVLIISAGALSFIVLYNLTNVNISERVREIATIKVLGFYDNEVSMYVFRENIVLTLLGAVLGLVLGIGLHRFIMVNIDLENIMFGRNIKFISFLYAFLITNIFAFIVNFVMKKKLKKIPMVESLKSIE